MLKRFIGRNIIYLVGIILLIGVFSGCSSEISETSKDKPASSLSSIAPEEAKKRFDSEEKIVIVDVRTKEEYESGHIEGSILIPVDNLKEEVEEIIEDKEIPVIVYCRSGNRSAVAAKILVELGYKDIYDLGGINNWPYEVVK